MPARWPESYRLVPADGNTYLAAVWLLSRHPRLAALVERIPGLVTVYHDGPDFDLDALTQAINDFDSYSHACGAYVYGHPAPGDPREQDAWQAGGPVPSPVAGIIDAMSDAEQAHLRLLATLSVDRVEFSLQDLSTFDENDQRFVQEWHHIAIGTPYC